MQANWSLILNVILLVVVVVAIARLMKSRRQNFQQTNYQPPSAKSEPRAFDDIIAVRKISPHLEAEEEKEEEAKSYNTNQTSKKPALESGIEPIEYDDDYYEENAPQENSTLEDSKENNTESGKSVMLFLLAKENRQLAGYELLQTVLAAGLRFGEGHLFHRHQYANGQGPILCSLAAATPTGVFDLQNIGAFTVRGLCLFMQSSGNSAIDRERFIVMLETAKQLSDELDTLLLDEQKRPLTQAGLAYYYQLLKIKEPIDIQLSEAELA